MRAVVVLDAHIIEKLEHEAATCSDADLVAYLVDTLGGEMTAYIAGIDNVDVVQRWADAEEQPDEPAGWRLRVSYVPTRMLVTVYGPETTKAWFFGQNTRLDDEAPAHLLRYATDPLRVQPIVPAARAFAGAAA
jgi:hypothetical protein